MKKLVGQGFDDHPAGDPDRARASWIVSVLDDCDGCGDTRVELVLEEVGRPGEGMSGHLAPATARLLRAAVARALGEIGEPAD
jgi:hypothetical protein